MTLNGVVALTLRHFNEFENLRSNSYSLPRDFIDQKSASVTHRAVKVVNSRIHWWSKFHRYLLVICRLSFALPLWWFLLVMLGFRFTVNTVWPMSVP